MAIVLALIDVLSLSEDIVAKFRRAIGREGLNDSEIREDATKILVKGYFENSKETIGRSW